MRQIIIEKAGDLAIDGEAKPGGKYHYMVFVGDDLVCGGYVEQDGLQSKIAQYLNEDNNEDL